MAKFSGFRCDYCGEVRPDDEKVTITSRFRGPKGWKDRDVITEVCTEDADKTIETAEEEGHEVKTAPTRKASKDETDESVQHTDSGIPAPDSNEPSTTSPSG